MPEKCHQIHSTIHLNHDDGACGTEVLVDPTHCQIDHIVFVSQDQ